MYCDTSSGRLVRLSRGSRKRNLGKATLLLGDLTRKIFMEGGSRAPNVSNDSFL